MANIASQKKRIARTERERQENLRFGGATKTYMRQLERAMAAGDESAADEAQRKLISGVDKAVQKGAMHKNTGARKKARAARVRAGAVPAAPSRTQARPQAEADPRAPAETEPTHEDAAEPTPEVEPEPEQQPADESAKAS